MGWAARFKDINWYKGQATFDWEVLLGFDAEELRKLKAEQQQEIKNE